MLKLINSQSALEIQQLHIFDYVSLLLVDGLDVDDEEDVSVFVLDSDFSPLSFFFSPDPEELVEPASVDDFLA